MKKHFTLGQIKWIVIICLLAEAVTHASDLVKGFKDGWNGTKSVAVK